jgi:phosphoenolpyruvate synthase/pyruvate phosphate dikinase
MKKMRATVFHSPTDISVEEVPRPNAYPEFAQFLVEQKIDSISLNPDSVLKTTLAILQTEKRLRT